MSEALMNLIPEWKNAWRMYSVWIIAALTLLGSTSPYVADVETMLGLSNAQSVILEGVVGLAAIMARLLSQSSVSGGSDEAQE